MVWSAEGHSVGVDFPSSRKDVPDELQPVGDVINTGGRMGTRISLFFTHTHTHTHAEITLLQCDMAKIEIA